MHRNECSNAWTVALAFLAGSGGAHRIAGSKAQCVVNVHKQGRCHSGIRLGASGAFLRIQPQIAIGRESMGDHAQAS